MKALPRCDAVPVFEEVQAELLRLLEGLSEAALERMEVTGDHALAALVARTVSYMK